MLRTGWNKDIRCARDYPLHLLPFSPDTAAIDKIATPGHHVSLGKHTQSLSVTVRPRHLFAWQSLDRSTVSVSQLPGPPLRICGYFRPAS